MLYAPTELHQTNFRWHKTQVCRNPSILKLIMDDFRVHFNAIFSLIYSFTFASSLFLKFHVSLYNVNITYDVSKNITNVFFFDNTGINTETPVLKSSNIEYRY